MRFDVLTLIPDFFASPLKQSIIGRALEKGIIEVYTHNIRDYTTDKHKTADDTPYGGGHGMVMKVEPVVRAIEEIKKEEIKDTLTVLTTPQGSRFNHRMAVEFSKKKRLIIVCGRYEGIDERIRAFVDIEVSIGDYVLTGGEIASLVIIDSCARHIRGVLGDELSSATDSFSDGLLEYPQYTRPEEWRGMRIPDILLSGNHKEISRFRRRESLKRTLERRPELLKDMPLTEEDKETIKKLTQA